MDGLLSLWDIRNKHQLSVVALNDAIRCMASFPSDEIFKSGSDNQKIKTVSILTGHNSGRVMETKWLIGDP